MKKIIATILACVAIMSYARQYVPTEGWPYLFSDFIEAVVHYQDGKCESARINVHLLDNELHFTDGEKIMIVHNAARIDSVVCENGKTLLYKGRKYVDRIAHTQHVVIGTTCEIDLNALTDSNGAYGMSTTTAATQNVASFRDHGNVAAHRYLDMIADRHNTSEVPTITHNIFIINDRLICKANKRGVSELLDKEQKKAFNTFLKENKIKWKDNESLILVARYLDTIAWSEE